MNFANLPTERILLLERHFKMFLLQFKRGRKHTVRRKGYRF